MHTSLSCERDRCSSSVSTREKFFFYSQFEHDEPRMSFVSAAANVLGKVANISLLLDDVVG